MEGSSESGWQKFDYAEGFDTSAASGTNFISLHAKRLRFSRDAFHGCELRKEADNSSMAGSDQYDIVSDPSRNSENATTSDRCLYPVEGGNVNLRQWLDMSERSVDVVQCVSIFRQIVEIVNKVHSQGITFQKLLPSCFAISTFNHVSLIDSVLLPESGYASCDSGTRLATTEFIHSVAHLPSFSGSIKSMLGNDDLLPETAPAKPFSISEANWRQTSSCTATNLQVKHEINGSRHFKQPDDERQPLMVKNILLLERTWYISPEEVAGAPSSSASDIFRLGVLLFELFCPCISIDEKCTTMSSLRHRVLPPQFLLRWPKEVSFCLWLLHPDPASRPHMGELLESKFFTEARDSSEDCEAERVLNEQILEQELLLEFLFLSQQQKEDAAYTLQESISLVSFDIDDVTRLQPSIQNGGVLPVSGNNMVGSDLPLYIIEHEGSDALGFRKRLRLGLPNHYVVESDSKTEERKSGWLHADQESAVFNSPRLLKNFKMLESAYFLTRQRAVKQTKNMPTKCSALNNCGRWSTIVNERSSMGNMMHSEPSEDNLRIGWIGPFLEGLCKYLSCSKLKIKAEVKQGDLLNSSNLVCALSFDRDGDFFASAGVNKKIKVFDCDSILNEDRAIHYPAVELACDSKLSSVCWNSYIKSQIASSNFEGVVQVWDVTRNQLLCQMKEHERRVWSVDFSATDPTLLASGSDDGSVKLWSVNQDASVGTIKAKANVCCVQFPSSSSRTLAFGSADHGIYYYDLRNPRTPLCTLVGHGKTVSYVKFIDSTNLVSASTDNTLKLWDLSLSSSVTPVLESPTQSFTGHLNVKNFVGLSVYDGYIATGSETNEVFIYHKAFPMPALSFKFNAADPLSGQETHDAAQFVSSVCWRGQSSTLVAASSTGNIKILEMV
uniref:Protein kinase domain-containing protein n=1 Tax=Kalanchoe fedtschenkoi TaxID=63787 RepID=A0A7N0V0K2_KALFE